MNSIARKWQEMVNERLMLMQKVSAQHKEIAKLKALMIARDNGKHDITCTSRYRNMSYEKTKSCNCGHFDVQEYLRETVK